MKGDPHFDIFHVLSNLLIFGGFILLSAAWRVLYKAQHSHLPATTGPYAYVRHPQYVAFILIMFGFLLQWPTLITLVMFPILVFMYVSLAKREEREVCGRVWRDVQPLCRHDAPFLSSAAKPGAPRESAMGSRRL